MSFACVIYCRHRSCNRQNMNIYGWRRVSKMDPCRTLLPGQRDHIACEAEMVHLVGLGEALSIGLYFTHLHLFDLY